MVEALRRQPFPLLALATAAPFYTPFLQPASTWMAEDCREKGDRVHLRCLVKWFEYTRRILCSTCCTCCSCCCCSCLLPVPLPQPLLLLLLLLLWLDSNHGARLHFIEIRLSKVRSLLLPVKVVVAAAAVPAVALSIFIQSWTFAGFYCTHTHTPHWHTHTVSLPLSLFLTLPRTCGRQLFFVVVACSQNGKINLIYATNNFAATPHRVESGQMKLKPHGNLLAFHWVFYTGEHRTLFQLPNCSE